MHETPEQCTIREIKEELNVDVEIQTIINVWMYPILNKVDVLIVTYLCKPLLIDESTVRISHEHKEAGLFTYKEIAGLTMPEVYKKSIELALSLKS